MSQERKPKTPGEGSNRGKKISYIPAWKVLIERVKDAGVFEDE